MLVLREEGKGNPLKNQWSKNESYQQTQPICNVESGFRTWTSLVGLARSSLQTAIEKMSANK